MSSAGYIYQYRQSQMWWCVCESTFNCQWPGLKHQSSIYGHKQTRYLVSTGLNEAGQSIMCDYWAIFWLVKIINH